MQKPTWGIKEFISGLGTGLITDFLMSKFGTKNHAHQYHIWVKGNYVVRV